MAEEISQAEIDDVQKSGEITNLEKMRGLPWSVAFNTSNQIFAYLTFFGPMIVLFLNLLGFSKTQIGTTLGILYATGIFSVFLAPMAARIGYKRTFRTFMATRAGVVIFLLFTPYVLSKYGEQAVVYYVMAIVGLFAFFRTATLTGWMPWSQEYVPDAVRGKFSAISNIFTNLSGFVTVLVAGWVVGDGGDLNKFLYLFASSFVFAFATVWAAGKVPGGAPSKVANTAHLGDILAALADKGFILFMLGNGLVTISTEPMNSFLPLYLNEEVGLLAGTTIYIQAASMMGGILSSYLWGWTADRYGSKPVMLWGLTFRAFVPILWFILPHQSSASVGFALAISFFSGAAGMGWAIGSSRMLFVSLVPREKSVDYMAVWSTWGGVTWALSQVLGGWILDTAVGFTGTISIFTFDSYALLFLLAFFLPLLSSVLFRKLKEEVGVSVGEFASLFFHGNPFMAVNSMIRFQRARDERTTVVMTEKLGQSHSPLTVEELLEAVSDPRFNVRFEAIISIARREPDPRLTAVLCSVLEKDEPALSVVAAWALGRIGDEDALETLRDALDAPYRSVQAHSARSLGTLKDASVTPLLVRRLSEETDMGLKVAFTSALGKLGAVEAVPDMLALLYEHDDPFLQMEIALALARIIGEEYHFIHLLRGVRQDAGTTASRAVSEMGKKLDARLDEEQNLLFGHCADSFARSDLEQGVADLVALVERLPMDISQQPAGQILQECIGRLKEFGASRLDYLILLLHDIKFGWDGAPTGAA